MDAKAYNIFFRGLYQERLTKPRARRRALRGTFLAAEDGGESSLVMDSLLLSRLSGDESW